MSEFLTFKLDLAFHEDTLYDLGAILRKLAEQVEEDQLPVFRAQPILDLNGNRIGTVTIGAES